MFPPIQAESAENNRCAVNEGTVWFDDVTFPESEDSLCECERGQGRVCLGQVDREVNTVAVSLVAMTALSPPQGLWLCVCVCVCMGGKGLV